jgi:fructan beta-fructosidase
MKNPSLILSSFLMLFISCQENHKETSQEEFTFNEPFRPQYHFSPPAQWMNDPNGMVYWDGEYHLFYQYYPDSAIWGPMHWGHAISRDLVYWEHLPIALYPDENGWIFSGSAVMDLENTSGLGTKENPAMVAIFTYHDPVGEKEGRNDFQTQGIAYSTDNGRSWTMYSDNPVLVSPGINDFRDPKVFWHTEQNQWIMSLAVKDKISFYKSHNLIDWTYLSDFNPEWAAYGGVWECPDLFPMVTEDGEEKWILFVSINPGGPQGGSATQYFVGDFDGKSFTSTTQEIKWLDWGTDNYAGVTWSNIPESDGRRLFIGWMSNWNYGQVVPTSPWRSAMTLPRSIHLTGSNGDYNLISKPIDEIERLHTNSVELEGNEVEIENELAEFELNPQSNQFQIEFSNSLGEKLLIKSDGQNLELDRSKSGKVNFSDGFGNLLETPLRNLKIDHLRIFLDRSSVELFINDGELVKTVIIFPQEPYNILKLQGFDEKNRVHYLKSIWKNSN